MASKPTGREVSPRTAAAVIVLLLAVIGGLFWYQFTRPSPGSRSGDGPARPPQLPAHIPPPPQEGRSRFPCRVSAEPTAFRRRLARKTKDR